VAERGVGCMPWVHLQGPVRKVVERVVATHDMADRRYHWIGDVHPEIQRELLISMTGIIDPATVTSYARAITFFSDRDDTEVLTWLMVERKKALNAFLEGCKPELRSYVSYILSGSPLRLL
jgi:hypothetical protein